jgi:hypothetical protein
LLILGILCYDFEFEIAATPRELASKVRAMIENNQNQRELARETQKAEEAIARARNREKN